MNVAPHTACADDVAACYRLILGREPDPEGLAAHLAAGLPREALVHSLVSSPEYRARTESMGTVSMYGFDFVVRANQTLYGTEDYEPYVFHRLIEFMIPGRRFLDVGANIGVFSIHAARRGMEVMAVEARPSNCSLLIENARRANVAIELHPLAVSDRHGYAVLDLATESENAALRPGDAGRGDTIVALGLLDELIGGRRVDVMKIDIEGHEYRAMLGARKMLERCRPVIVTEYSPEFQQAGSGVPGSVYLEYLEQFGYRISMMLRSGELKPAAGIAEIDELCRRLGHHIDLLLEPTPLPIA